MVLQDIQRRKLELERVIRDLEEKPEVLFLRMLEASLEDLKAAEAYAQKEVIFNIAHS